jgi:hypothetical protein
LFLGTELSAFAGSAISQSTIRAYLATEYRVGDNLRFTLIVGRPHWGLKSLLAGHRASAAAVVTAWNPWSKRRSRTENDREQYRLVEELDRRRFVHFPGHGVDPTGKWPAEDSRLVLRIGLSEAVELGTRYRQNGIVWAAGDALPILVLLR